MSRSSGHKSTTGSKGKGKGKHNAEFDLCRTLMEAEDGEASDPVRKLTIELEPGDYTDEKFELYKRYQMAIHHDTEAKASQIGFTRFLCNPVIEVQSFFKFRQSTSHSSTVLICPAR
jgi:arginyl-tRNA---protein transferase